MRATLVAILVVLSLVSPVFAQFTNNDELAVSITAKGLAMGRVCHEDDGRIWKALDNYLERRRFSIQDQTTVRSAVMTQMDKYLTIFRPRGCSYVDWDPHQVVLMLQQIPWP